MRCTAKARIFASSRVAIIRYSCRAPLSCGEGLGVRPGAQGKYKGRSTKDGWGGASCQRQECHNKPLLPCHPLLWRGVGGEARGEVRLTLFRHRQLATSDSPLVIPCAPPSSLPSMALQRLLMKERLHRRCQCNRTHLSWQLPLHSGRLRIRLFPMA